MFVFYHLLVAIGCGVDRIKGTTSVLATSQGSLALRYSISEYIYIYTHVVIGMSDFLDVRVAER